jgi:hypothetical protein
LSSAADRQYTICKEEDRLIFTTPAYKVGPDSVLHSGIYNREFSSMLASAAVAGMIYAIVAMNSHNRLISSMVFLALFAAGVLFFRKFIFRESLMKAVFDAASGETKIYTTWITEKLRETIAIRSIKEIRIERRKQEVENPDAVQFVEKISAQHGTVIPGFGKEKVLFLLKLLLEDGTERTIYSGDSMQDVISAHEAIKEFLGLA